MHVKKDDIPLVAYPYDELWVVFRNSEPNAVAWVQSLSGDAVVEVASGATPDSTLLGVPTTLTFTQAGIVQKVNLPIGGGLLDLATRFKPTSGRVTVTIAAPSDFRPYMSVLRS